MAIKTCAVVRDSDNKVLRVIALEESDMNSYEFPTELANSAPFTLKIVDDPYGTRIGAIYVANVDMYSPPEAMTEDWTKNADGIWEQILTRPSNTHVWDMTTSAWMTEEEFDDLYN
ncbi:MAG: hypothetical protein VW270_13200 [Candidatus Poseidoniales archaeon]